MNVSPLPVPFHLRLRLAFVSALLAAVGMFVFCAIAPMQIFAQAGMPTGANYTDDMPSVDKVKTVIQGSDPVDTAARQVAVFDELVSYIDRVHTNRDVRGPFTPGEAKLYGDYRGASAQIAQDTKSRSAADAQRFTQLEGHYSFDSAFMNAWPKQLIVGQANAALNNANAGLQASAQRMYNQQMQDYQQAQAQTTNAQGLSNDPTAVAARRCLELGGDNLACVGKSFMGGLMDMVAGPGGLDALTGPGRAGVVLSGAYGGNQSGTHVAFGGDSGTLVSCGRLADDAYSYTLSKTATTLKITLATKPSAVTLTMRSDGSLLGPGAVTIIGRVVTGYEVITHYKNGVATGQDRVPQYAPATDRCALGALAAPPPPDTSASAASSAPMGGLLGGLMNSVVSVVSVSLPGLRMQGKYSSSGLLLDFAGDAVTLDCGQAHVKSPYTVENAADALIVHVQNSGGPFDLVVSSSNALRGSGSTTVNGRLVSGMDGDNVTFVPHSETCAIASFTPQTGAGATTTVAANASPAPTTATGPAIAMKVGAIPSAAPSAIADGARASFRLLIGTSFSGANPLANQSIFIMKKPMDQALRELGVSVPASATAGQAMEALKTLCRTPAGCSPAMSGLGSYYVSTAKLDGSGNATLTATAATGTYYVYAIVPQGTAALMWDVPAKVQAGDNTVTLTTANAEQVP